MIWIIVAIITGVITTVAVATAQEGANDPGRFYNILVSIVASLIVLVLGSIMVSVILPPAYSTERRQYSIISLETESRIGGHFVLSSGSIDNEISYFYYKVLDNGGYTLESCPAESAIIYGEAGTTDGKVVERLLTPSSALWSLSYPWVQYNIHIPEKSIIKEFSTGIGK